MGIFVGIDIGRSFHCYCAVEETGRKVVSGRILATREGLEELLEVLREREVVQVGMEATGHYWLNLCAELGAAGYRCSVLNPLATKYYRRMSLARHKTDAVDAECIARYLAATRPEGQGLGEGKRVELQALVRAQAEIAEQLTGAVNHLHHLVDLSFPELTQTLSELKSARVLAVLARYPTARALARASRLGALRYGSQGHRLGAELAKTLRLAARRSMGCAQGAAAELLIRQAVARIELLQAQERAVLKAMERLVLDDPAVAHLVTVPGLGVRSAAAVVGELGDIRRFPAPKQLIGFLGAHPRLHESGTKALHPRMSKAGNKRLRRILWQCTIVAIRHNPTIHALYEKKLHEGKRKMVAIGHCMNKLIRIIWGVLTYGEPFDPAGGSRLVKLTS